jgi:hypothetical protein
MLLCQLGPIALKGGPGLFAEYGPPAFGFLGIA